VVRIKLVCGATSRPFTRFDTHLGRHVCEGIWSGRTYPPIPFTGPIRTIVDVGANVGAATVYFALTHPEARIFAFEPCPESYALWTSNVEGLANVTGFNFGLSDRDGQLPLYLGHEDPVTNSLGASVLNGRESVLVSLRAAGVILAEQGIDTIDILKVDTEGCEVAILRTLAAWLPRTGIIYVEYHAAADRLEIDRLLAPTHLLCRGVIQTPHRGELCYAARDRIPATQGGTALEIRF
jgi:FkbM family methyltransferase